MGLKHDTGSCQEDREPLSISWETLHVVFRLRRYESACLNNDTVNDLLAARTTSRKLNSGCF